QVHRTAVASHAVRRLEQAPCDALAPMGGGHEQVVQHIDARGRDGREAREQLDETGQFPACGFGGTAYSSAGGEQSVTKTSTWRKDQRAGLSGASKPHSTAASTRTYASEPRPRCWRRCALGLSQYRP